MIDGPSFLQVFTLYFYYLCVGLSFVVIWSAIVMMIGLMKRGKAYPKADRKLKFAVIVCARNEERVIRLPVRSALMSKYPSDRREVIVLADNCTDATAARAREAGATVWEKTIPSHGKGDVLKWGIDKLRQERPDIDAIAIFDADNVCADNWIDLMNDALCAGETVATGRRMSSNARYNCISGWYTIYWSVMNELSNRVRTNLGLSGKLTGTGFAFLMSFVREHGWNTRTMVEDVEFFIQTNIRGKRIGYVADALYSDEQPIATCPMWRQLRRWATGCWQVVRYYLKPWAGQLCRRPSARLFDCFFAMLTGIAMTFVLFCNVLALVMRVAWVCSRQEWYELTEWNTYAFFFGVFGFLFIMGWFAAFASVALSPDKRRPSFLSMVTFPFFSLILAASVLYTVVFPTRVWKPIPHGECN